MLPHDNFLYLMFGDKKYITKVVKYQYFYRIKFVLAGRKGD